MRFQRDLPRIDLRYAKLCMELDCNTVFDSELFRHCPTCGSVEFYPLESWLNREPSQKASTAVVGAPGAAVPRGRWTERVREKRAESDARIAAEPVQIWVRAQRRRAG
jgi:predicted  nucleic acid-binding Zn-ribbon protein